MAFFLQAFWSFGREVDWRPFWAVNFTVALLVDLQMSRLLTKRPFLPPCMFKTNLETGWSGTTSKVLRMPPLTESMRPARVTSIGWWSGPRSATTRSGSGLSELRR